MRKAPLFLTGMALLLLLAGAQLLLPARDMSDMENRRLASAPAWTAEAFVGGDWAKSLETFAADQLPLRDQFVSLHTAAQTLLGRREGGGVIRSGDWLLDRSDGWSERNVRLNARALASLSEITGKPVYLLAVPSSACVYPEKAPAWAPLADEQALLNAAGEETALLPLLGDLTAARDLSPLYYRTDHHWTAAGARVGYLAACRALGLTPLDEAEIRSCPGFYGSYFARCPLPSLAPDTLTFACPSHVELVIDGETKEGLVDEAGLARRDKYAALLYGNHPVILLRCDSAAEGTLLVIKDSYANALLPALAQHFRQVVAVDPRYFTGDIAALAHQYEGDAILCVYGLNTLATGRTIQQLEGL